MPECTKAEREYLDAKYAYDLSHAMGAYDRVVEAHTAVLAERRAAEQVKDDAAVGIAKLSTPEEHRDYLVGKMQEAQARIASLETALAEERAKPKEGAVRFVAVEMGDGSWMIRREVLAWTLGGRRGETCGPDAERHAREHAARLQAEHDAKAGQS